MPRPCRLASRAARLAHASLVLLAPPVLLVAIILPARPASAAPPRPAAVEVVRGDAVVHAEPGFRGEVVARPVEGAVLEVVGGEKEFLLVVVDGERGFIHELHVTETSLGPRGPRGPRGLAARPREMPAREPRADESIAREPRADEPLRAEESRHREEMEPAHSASGAMTEPLDVEDALGEASKAVESVLVGEIARLRAERDGLREALARSGAERDALEAVLARTRRADRDQGGRLDEALARLDDERRRSARLERELLACGASVSDGARREQDAASAPASGGRDTERPDSDALADLERLEADFLALSRRALALEEGVASCETRLADAASGADAVHERLGERLEDISRERDRMRAEAQRLHAELEQARAGTQQRAGADAARIAELERELEIARRRPTPEAMRVAVDRARAEERAGLEQRHRAVLQDVTQRHDQSVERFIDEVTARHERVLSAELTRAENGCETRVAELRLEHERELQRARKQSGWEDDFRKAVREEVDIHVEEARARWEARQRGDRFDAERALREQEERLLAQAEARREAAITEAIAETRATAAERESLLRMEEQRRCRLALERVLERLADTQALPATCQELRSELRASTPAGAAGSTAALEPMPAFPTAADVSVPAIDAAGARPDLPDPSSADDLGRPGTVGSRR